MDRQEILEALTTNLRCIETALAILRNDHRRPGRPKAAGKRKPIWTAAMRRAAALRMKKRQPQLQAARKAGLKAAA